MSAWLKKQVLDIHWLRMTNFNVNMEDMMMTLYIKLKTTRTKSGYANARVSRFMNYSRNRISYSFQFYSDYKFFDHHKELRSYVLDKYNVDIGDRFQFWGL